MRWEVKDQIDKKLTEIFVLIEKGEYPQALILFTKIAFVIDLEDDSRSSTVPILFGLIWKSIQINIEDTVESNVRELEDGALDAIRTIPTPQRRESVLYEAELLAGASERLADLLMREVIEYTEDVLRVQNGIDPYTDSLLQKIARSFSEVNIN